ncbi:hypothetical protein BSKO_06137 [Bryopsis sp. KO-2023]|nr:hypothetical protein BSKO_06137 [Bryopsis sp. KO-2023]
MRGGGPVLRLLLVSAIVNNLIKDGHASTLSAEQIDAGSKEAQLSQDNSGGSRKLLLLGTSLVTAGINGRSLFRRSFSPPTARVPTFGTSTGVGNGFGSGLPPTSSVVDPVSGITFLRDPSTGRFFPVDPATGQILNPPPVLQQDPTTGASFVNVFGQQILVDPVLGRPLSLAGVGSSTFGGQVGGGPVNLQIGRLAVRLPAFGYSEGVDDDDFSLRVGNAFYSQNPFTGTTFGFGR